MKTSSPKGKKNGAKAKQPKKKKNGNKKSQAKRAQGKRHHKTMADLVRASGSYDEAMNRLNNGVRELFMTDPRSSYNMDIDQFVPNANPTIPYTVPTEAETFFGPIIAVTTFAVQRGWLIVADNESDPYFAAMYTWNFLVSAAQNIEPQLTTIPRWLHYMYQAVIQKNVRLAGGYVSYQFDVRTAFTPQSKWALGPTNSDATWILDPKSGAMINTIFSGSQAPAPYDADNGQRAAQAMWNYLQSQFPDEPMHAKVPTSSTNAMTKDASAFAVINTAPGGGFGKVGGWNQRVELEVPVRSPLFSVFKSSASSVTPEDNSRASNFILNFSGDGVQLGGKLVSGMDAQQLHMKTPVQPKFVDFLEFANVLAIYVCRLQELRVQTAEFQENLDRDPDYFDNFVRCPLTLLEMQLLLRAVMMEAFASTQYAYQSLYPRTVDNNENEFVSFVAGLNSCPYVGTTQMKIPLVMKHNILSITSRVIEMGKGGKRNPAAWVPILGKYAQDSLKTENYVVNICPEDPQYCFRKSGFETSISLIDGKSGNTWVYINDPSAIQTLAEQWNLWIARMLDHTYPVEPVGTEKGIDPFWMLCSTLHWRPADLRGTLADPRSVTKVGKTEVTFTKGATKKVVDKEQLAWENRFKPGNSDELNSIYVAKNALVISSSVPMFREAWEMLLQFYIYPMNLVGPPQSGDPTTFTGYTRIAAFRRETQQYYLGVGDQNFMTMQERHENFANLMIKTKFAPQDPLYAWILEQDKQGNGGVLSSLAASLAGHVFPKAAPALNAIASVIPF